MILRLPAIVLNFATHSHSLNALHFQWSLEAQLKYSLIYPLPMSLLIPLLCHTLPQSCHLLPASIGCACWGIGSGGRAAALASMRRGQSCSMWETANSCQLLLDPLPDTAEALQPCVGYVGHLGENLFKKEKMLLSSECNSVRNSWTYGS